MPREGRNERNKNWLEELEGEEEKCIVESKELERNERRNRFGLQPSDLERHSEFYLGPFELKVIVLEVELSN